MSAGSSALAGTVAILLLAAAAAFSAEAPPDSAPAILAEWSGAAVLRWSNGDRCAEDSFLPHDEVLAKDRPRQFAAWSSNGNCFPFFNLKGPGGGWVLAIGWTGNWKAEFVHAGDGTVRVRPAVRIDAKPASVLIRYRRLPNATEESKEVSRQGAKAPR